MLRLAFALMLLALPATAQDFSALARIDGDQSRITDTRRGGVEIDLLLSQGVPYRLFTLDNPPRLVMDFQEVDWQGLTQDALLHSQRIKGVQFGIYRPGWSRLVAELAQPMKVKTAGLTVDESSAQAQLLVHLTPVSPETFAAQAGAPQDPRWDLPDAEDLPAPPAKGAGQPMVVVLDPGHGGIDPGAERGNITEKDLLLKFALELHEVLTRTGDYSVVLTRDGDHFVSLEHRLVVARRAGADVFISLHADALTEGLAHGATVHVLSDDASDAASAKLAERHDRADLLAGATLEKTDDVVTGVMLDLARQETRPRTAALADALVSGMGQSGGPMNRRPLRAAAFSVLKSADIPSVLIELGFLSSPRDFKNLTDPAWRARMANGIRAGLDKWRTEDAARRPLVRQ